MATCSDHDRQVAKYPVEVCPLLPNCLATAQLYVTKSTKTISTLKHRNTSRSRLLNNVDNFPNNANAVKNYSSMQRKVFDKHNIGVISIDNCSNLLGRLSKPDQRGNDSEKGKGKRKRKEIIHRLCKTEYSAAPVKGEPKAGILLSKSAARETDPNKQLPEHPEQLHATPLTPCCACSGERQATTDKSQNVCKEKVWKPIHEESKLGHTYDDKPSGGTSEREPRQGIFSNSYKNLDQTALCISEAADFARVVENNEGKIPPLREPPGEKCEECTGEFTERHPRKEASQIYLRKEASQIYLGYYEKKNLESLMSLAPKESDVIDFSKNLFLNIFQNTFETIIVVQPSTFLSLWGLSKQERMRHEIARLATFHLLNGLAVSAIRLAMTGFYYEEEIDEIKCFSCGVCKRHWEKSERPALVHLRISPECRHANFSDSSNVPFDEKNYTLLETSARSQTIQTTQQPQESLRPSASISLMEPRDSLDSEPEPREGNELASGEQQMSAAGSSADRRNQAKVDSSSLISSGTVLTDSESSSAPSYFEKPEPGDFGNCGSGDRGNCGSGDLGNFDFVAPPRGGPSNKATKTILRTPPVISVYTTLQAYSDKQCERFPVQAKQPAACTYQLPTAETGSAESRDSNQSGDIADPPTPGLDMCQAASPTNIKITTRLLSFANTWSRLMTGQNPKELASAGFYYLGVGDSVRCFYCAITLGAWKPGDDPWVVHVLARFSCAYVTAVKGDNFVVQTLAGHGREHRWRPPSNEQLHLPSFSVLSGSSVGSGTRNSQNTISGEREGPGQPDNREGGSARNVSRNIGLPFQGPSPASTCSVSFAMTGPGEVSIPATASSDARGEAGSSCQTDGEAADVASDPSGAAHRRLTPVSPNLDSQLRHLVDTNRRLRERRTCRACRARTVDTIFLPCGHICTCETCAKNTKRCILCLSHVRGTAHVYLD